MNQNIPLVIVSIFKNEARYLREFLTFHQIVGFEKFYLYNNQSNDNYLEILQPYIDKGIVILTEWPSNPPCQLQAYADFINKNNRNQVWCAFIDIDEFIFPTKETDTLSNLLNNINHPCAVGVNWRCFGSSGLLEYDPRLVIDRFTFRKEHYGADVHIKSIIRLDQTVLIGGDPHFFNVEFGTIDERGNPIHGPFSGPYTETYRINHYLTKSREECLAKKNRGRADVANLGFNLDIFKELEDATYEDKIIQRFLPELKRKLEAGCAEI